MLKRRRVEARWVRAAMIGNAAAVCLIVGIMSCRCSSEEPSKAPDAVPSVPSMTASVPSVPSTAPSVISAPEVLEVMQELPEEAVYVMGNRTLRISSRRAAEKKNEPWKLPYPYELQLEGELSCGFFPALHGPWRVAYCLEDGKRVPYELHLLRKGEELYFSVKGRSFGGFYPVEKAD